MVFSRNVDITLVILLKPCSYKNQLVDQILNFTTLNNKQFLLKIEIRSVAHQINSLIGLNF